MLASRTAIVLTLILLLILPTGTALGGSSGSPAPDIAVQGETTNQVWFAPYPHTPYYELDNHFWVFNGSEDYYKLFTDETDWAQARSGVDVFKFYGWWLQPPPNAFVNDSLLSFIISKLNSWGIKVAVEEGALQNETCGGFEGLGLGTGVMTLDLQRFKSLGGNVSYIDMDSPYWAGTTTKEPNSCGWTPEYTARQVNKYIEAVHRVFPRAIVGEIEVVQAKEHVGMVEDWMETYKRVNGQYLPFLHLDLSRRTVGWEDMAAELQEYADQRGVRFGMPYYSDWWYTSDKQWFDDVQAGVLSYEVKHGMRPDDALFQSWNPFPRHVLPEGANYTFTHLLDLYLRQRTYIAMNAQTSDGRSASASGTLKGFDGEPLGHSAVTVYERALSEASYHGYVMSGTFPLGTVSALMILTLNPPNGCSGANDFSLYNITFRQGLDPANLAPNYNFGIDSINGGGWDWSTWGNGTAEVVPSDSGGGRMLHLATNVSTTVGLISRGIQVTGGLNYTAVFFTKVALDSSGCDIFEIHFFSDPGGTWGCCHLGEDVIFPEPPETVAGSQSTDVSGFFSQEYFPAANGSSVLTVFYGGDSEHWPTQTEFSVGAWNQTSVRFKDAHPYTVSFHIPYNGRNAVGILTNSTNVSGFTFSPQGKSIRFVVDGNTGTEGYARVSIPSSLMGGPFSASIDGVDWPMEQVPSADGTILTLHYHHSVHTIAIFAASVSPPSTTTAVSTQQAPTSSFTSAASSTNPGASSTVTTTSPGSGSSAGVRVEYLLFVVGGIALAVIAATLTVVLRKRR